MKKTILLFVLTCLGFSLNAQDKDQKTTIKVRTKTDNNVNEQVVSFNKALSQKEINKIVDSLSKDSKDVTVTVEIDANNDEKKEWTGKSDRRRYDFEKDVLIEEDEEMDGPRARVYGYRNGRKNLDSERFRQRLEDIGDDIPRHIQNLDDYVLDAFHGRPIGEGPINGLKIYPNNPASNHLNIRFFAPKKGDINLTLLDVKGNAIAKETIKDFTGEYVGQISFEKDKKGTFFLMATQGDEGDTAKVTIK